MDCPVPVGVAIGDVAAVDCADISSSGVDIAVIVVVDGLVPSRCTPDPTSVDGCSVLVRPELVPGTEVVYAVAVVSVTGCVNVECFVSHGSGVVLKLVTLMVLLAAIAVVPLPFVHPSLPLQRPSLLSGL